MISDESSLEQGKQTQEKEPRYFTLVIATKAKLIPPIESLIQLHHPRPKKTRKTEGEHPTSASCIIQPVLDPNLSFQEAVNQFLSSDVIPLSMRVRLIGLAQKGIYQRDEYARYMRFAIHLTAEELETLAAHWRVTPVQNPYLPKTKAPAWSRFLR